MKLKNTFWAVCAAILLAPGLAPAGTIADWKAAGDIVVGDKTFTFISSTANLLATDVNISEVVPGLFTVNIGNGQSNIIPGAAITGADGDLKYSVTITDPLQVFKAVELDTTHIGFASRVDKIITGGGSPHLVSINGSASFAPLSGQFISVDDKIHIDKLSAIVSLQNTFAQVGVPEPGTLAGWALGLAVMGGFSWVKRRKVATAA